MLPRGEWLYTRRPSRLQIFVLGRRDTFAEAPLNVDEAFQPERTNRRVA